MQTFVTTSLDTHRAIIPPVPTSKDLPWFRLDPQMYAWLRAKMNLVKRAHSNGRLTQQAFDAMRTRFNAVHDLAVAEFGLEDLANAVESLPAEWVPTPVPVVAAAKAKTMDLFIPAEYNPALVFHRPVSFHAYRQVQGIRDKALELGWTETELLQTRGRHPWPVGPEYGLVTLIRSEQRLGQVTDRAIEIVCPGGHSLSFYRRTA